MPLLTLAGLAMLVVWVAGVWFLGAPGIIHLLLTLGVFLLVLGAVKRAERARGGSPKGN